MIYKNKAVMHDFCDVRLHPTLTKIMYTVEAHVPCVVTSARREDGIHGTDPLRAVDIRGDWEDFINKRFEYDHQRPHMRCAIYHDTGSGWHTHLQVHPNTVRKG